MIPKQLHLHWLFDEFPPFYTHVISEWKTKLIGWNVKVIKGLSHGIPKVILELLVNEKIPTPFRGDLFRYWYMYEYGGVYVDFDTLPGGVPLDIYLNNECVLLRTKFHGGKKSFVDNSLMMSVPKHPFWKDTLSNALTPALWKIPEFWFCGWNSYPDPIPESVTIVENIAEEVPEDRAKAFIDSPHLEKGSPIHCFTHYRASKSLDIRGIGTQRNNPTWLDVFKEYPEPVDIDEILT